MTHKFDAEYAERMDWQEVIASQLIDTTEMAILDVEAVAEEVLLASPGGKARAPIDFCYEVAIINRRIAMRLKGESPGQLQLGPDGYVLADPACLSKPRIAELMRETAAELADAIRTFPRERLGENLPGTEWTPVKLMLLSIVHVMYHDGQLNYLQALNGDAEVHWT